MDANKARQQLRDWNEALAAVDEERVALVALIRGIEVWLRLHGDKSDATSEPAATSVVKPQPPATSRKRKPGGKNAPKGTISLRQAVLRVIQDAHGSPVHLREISARAMAMGAVTSAKDPERMVDLVAYNLKTRSEKPIERISPRSWRYIGENNGDGR